MSYAIPIVLRITVAKNTFEQGPFNLGRWSILVGWVSFIFLTLTNIFFVFPTSFDENMEQTPLDFNYTCVVYGGALLIAMIYWFFPVYGARNNFKGPKRPDDEDFELDENGNPKEFHDMKLADGPNAHYHQHH